MIFHWVKANSSNCLLFNSTVTSICLCMALPVSQLVSGQGSNNKQWTGHNQRLQEQDMARTRGPQDEEDQLTYLIIYHIMPQVYEQRQLDHQHDQLISNAIVVCFIGIHKLIFITKYTAYLLARFTRLPAISTILLTLTLTTLKYFWLNQ